MYPMFPSTVPLCCIQWIDCKGEPTPDENPAVGLASITINGEKRSFPICAEHAKSMGVYCHHDAECHHLTTTPAGWKFEAFNKKEG